MLELKGITSRLTCIQSHFEIGNLWVTVYDHAYVVAFYFGAAICGFVGFFPGIFLGLRFGKLLTGETTKF